MLFKTIIYTIANLLNMFGTIVCIGMWVDFIPSLQKYSVAVFLNKFADFLLSPIRKAMERVNLFQGTPADFSPLFAVILFSCMRITLIATIEN